VPVGEDQRQHLELTRDIAGRFNGAYGSIFPLPEAFIAPSGARIMSLQDPSKKMSKSDGVDANVITLLDSPEAITRKIKRAVTDSGGEIVMRDDKPGVSNLLHILSATIDVAIDELQAQYSGQGYGQLKQDVADSVIAVVQPIQTRFAEIRSDEQALDDLMQSGADRAHAIAQSTLSEVRDALGMIKSVR